MKDAELIELARAYVALSNAHRVDLILPMFATGALYTSTAVGEHRGQAAIGDMMHGFFAEYPDVHWEAANFQCDDHQVSFKFTMTVNAGDDDPGPERRGMERIEFTADGSIKKLAVESR